MKLQVQKLLNSKFNGIRSLISDPTKTSFYSWDDNSGFDVANFTEYESDGLQIGAGTNVLFSHYTPVVNTTGDVYTISGLMMYINATATNAKFTIRELGSDLTTIANTNWQPNLNSSLTSETYTFGADAENDLQLNVNTVGIQILINQTNTSNYIWNINTLKVLGKAITLDKDLELPADQTQNLLQKSGETSSGKILAPTEYGEPLKKLTLSLSRISRQDYDKLYEFLTHNDVLFTFGSFDYIDYLSNTYFGKFFQRVTVIDAEFYFGCFLTLDFAELPW